MCRSDPAILGRWGGEYQSGGPIGGEGEGGTRGGGKGNGEGGSDQGEGRVKKERKKIGDWVYWDQPIAITPDP